MDNFDRLDCVAVYRVVAQIPTFTRRGHSKPLPGPSLTGALAVVIGPSDADGDLPLVFDDGRFEFVAWHDVEPYDGEGARYRAEVMRRSLIYYTTELDAIEGYRAVLARRRWLMENASKRCSSCGEDKPLSAFGQNASRDDGLAHSCLECEAERKRRSREMSA